MRTTPQTGPAPMFDRHAALDRVGGDLTLLREIAGLFLEECPALLERIHSSLRLGSGTELEQAAHALKGAVANFTPDHPTETARCLESLGRTGDLDRAAEVLSRLEAELRVLSSELRAL